jgi:hypothetical protein
LRDETAPARRGNGSARVGGFPLDGRRALPTNAAMSLGAELSPAEAAALTDECRQRYLANLALLYGCDPELAARVDALPFAQTPPLERTRDGAWTVRVTADDGRSIYAHSRVNPLAEARALVARLPAEDTSAFLLAGLGLGYHVTALTERGEQPLVVVVEPDLGLLKAALTVTDFGALLREHRLVILTSADRAALHTRLERVNTDLMLGLRFVTPPTADRCHADVHAQVRALLLDFIAYGKMQLVTLLRNARLTARNVAMNLPAYLRNPGVEVLRNRAAGYPAIVVGAGPSLARNIDQLGQWRGRAVVIAVQTVLQQLLARGVPPHFVTSLDFHDISANFFHGVGDFGETILVAEPKATPLVIDAFPGRKHLVRHPLVSDLLCDAAPPRDSLRSGTTVAHLSYYLAEYLGCDPIIFLGQDLSFTEGLYYAPGLPIERVWLPELNRFHTVEMKHWERIVRARGILRRVTDIHGRPAFTDDQMFTYAEQFMADFAQSTRRLVHACEGGMALAGMEYLTLRAAGERYCTRDLPRDLFALPPATDATPLVARALDELDARLGELAELRTIAGEMSTLLARLVELLDRPAEFNRVVARVDELRTRIQRYDRMYRVVTGVSQVGELRRYTADRRMGTVTEETPAVARRRLERDREFVAAFAEGCDYLAQLLPEVRARLAEGAA